MIRTPNRMRLCAALILVNLVFIWGNSLLPASISSRISRWVQDLIACFSPTSFPGGESGHGTLRKLAHFCEFCLLGTGFGWLAGMLRKKPWLPLVWGLSVACIDETIQRFVPGRGPSIKDVAIDTAGAALGITLLLCGHTLLNKRKQKFLEENEL